MNRKPLVVHVTTTDMSLALLLGPQLRAFAEAGYEVMGASAPGPFLSQLKEWGIGHVQLRHATRSAAPHRDVLALGELFTHFRDLRPDIVHTHNPKPGVYGRLAGCAARTPVVVNTVHGLYALPDDRWRKRALVYGLERLASTCSDTELVQNPEDVEVLHRIGVPETKVRLLGNGIDLKRFSPDRVSSSRRIAIREGLGFEPDQVVIGAVGRLVWEKGYRELFRAADLLRSRLPQTRFVIVGPMDLAKSDAVMTFDIERASASGVSFLGMRDDAVDLYAAMDMYVLASHREGFPRSAMEAAAMGLPIVATNIRGCRQVVSNGVNGVLVPPRDTDALADALAGLVSDEAARGRMGVAGRVKAIREFDQQSVIDTTLEVYGRLMADKGKRVVGSTRSRAEEMDTTP